MSDVRNVIILGSGAAGLTAAIYSARANLKPLLIEGTQPGGQLTITSDVENFPGFPEGILGPKLMEDMHNQAERFGTEFLYDLATEVDLSARPYRVEVDGQTLLTRTLIISTGASSKWLGLPHEQGLIGRGVSSCATCDGFFYRNLPVVVIGGGDTALEEALFLTRFASTVTVVHRRDTLRASKIMQARAFKNEKMRFVWDSVVTDVLDMNQQKVTGVKLQNVKTGAESVLEAAGLFVAIGHKPNTDLFVGQLAMDEVGYLLTHRGVFTIAAGPDGQPLRQLDGEPRIVPGVYAAGDVQDPIYRQAITAAGTGCMAAIEAERFLEAEAHAAETAAEQAGEVAVH